MRDLDVWLTTAHGLADAAAARVLDVIDVPHDRLPTPRRPSRDEQAATSPNPTPGGRQRTSARPDPTLSAIVRWETQVETAVTRLETLVGDLLDLAGELATAAVPNDLPTVVDGAGRRRVVVAPAHARRHVLVLHSWLKATVGTLAEWAPHDDPDVRAFRMQTLKEAGRLLSKAAGPSRRRLCVCGCGRTTRPGEGATHPTCRSRRHREAVT